MTRGRTKQFLTWRYEDGFSRRPDELLVEEPLSIQLDGTLVATTMRTPGEDFELAVGFCHNDGLLAGAPVTGIRYCADGPPVDNDFNVVNVETAGKAPVPTPRLGATSSSCGLCGAEAIDQLAERLQPFETRGSLGLGSIDAMLDVIDGVRAHQALFGRTGSSHAAATFDADGRIDLVREDIGRHNAVDKVVGARVLASVTPDLSTGLFVSGRASFEMVQKAWAGGFATLVAVGAPSALAVDTARRANLTLVGFAGSGTANVYAPADISSTPSC